jgi:GNAT superfamily N-acetyltransferase
MSRLSQLTIRSAVSDDLAVLYTLDLIAAHEAERRAFIARAVEAGECFVAEVGGQVIGYGVLEYSFFGQGFVSMLYTHPEHRRRGTGAALLRTFEATCRTPKLFTSTNLSNLPMQTLLAKVGYTLSGVIHNLDEGDPELVFVRFITPRVQNE